MTATLSPPPPPAEPAPPAVPPPPSSGRRRARKPRQPKAPLPPLPQWRVMSAISFLTLAGVALWCVVYIFVLSSIQHARSQHELYGAFRAELAQATAPIGGIIPIGKPVALLSVPAAHLDNEVVVEGTTSGAMRAGPGHLRSSPLPGQPGVSVIYGRAVSFGAPFGDLDSVNTGAQISVTTDQGVFKYVVTDVRRAGDKWVLPLAGQSELTLITSEGGWRPDRLLYVDALLQGKAVPDPGGRLTSVTPQEHAMAGENDSGTLMQLVLWLQLLVAIAIGIAWLMTRWRPAQVWVVAVPAVLAALWGVSNIVVRLLPNLL